jgi:class 3 adenylate cyclase
MTDAMEESNAARGDGRPLRLKLGLHRGPVIVVTLNNRIDYFGRTVNIASRVQSLSGPNELSLMKSVLAAPGVKPALQERVSRVSRSTTRLKGIDEVAEVYKVRLG